MFNKVGMPEGQGADPDQLRVDDAQRNLKLSRRLQQSRFLALDIGRGQVAYMRDLLPDLIESRANRRLDLVSWFPLAAADTDDQILHRLGGGGDHRFGAGQVADLNR